MCRRILGSILVAATLVIGFHADVAARRPNRYVICETAIQGVLSIEVLHREKVKDAVEHCLSFWHGVVLDIEK